MNLQDQDRLWLTEGQKCTKERTLLDPFALYGFFSDANTAKTSGRRVKSALARTNSTIPNKIKNRNHPPGYKTPDFHVGHNPNPTPATSRPASSRSGYSSVRTKFIKINQSSPTSLYLSTQRNRCKSAPVKPAVYEPRRPQTANSKSRTASATVRGAPQRAWELRTNSFTNYRSLLSPKEIQMRQKTRCKSAPLPYDFSSVELINEVPENGTDYERLCAMTKPFSCMPELVKNAVNHNGLRHCCFAYNTRTTVPPETRKQFWPVPRPGVYSRGFVPQYFSFVKPAQFSGDSPPPVITCTKPTAQDLHPDDFEETILFEENFEFPDTPSELSLSEQYDLSDNDADIIDDTNVREYLESRLGYPDPEDYDDREALLSRFTPEPISDQEENKESVVDENQMSQDIEVEITVNQTKLEAPIEPKPEPEISHKVEPEIIQNEEPDYTESEPQPNLTEQESIIIEPTQESHELDSEEIVVQNIQAKEEENIPEEKPVNQPKVEKPSLPITPHPDPPKVTFVNSITVTSFKAVDKTLETSKPILKQPKSTPPLQPPPMEEKPVVVKKPKPRPMVERREADIKPQVKPEIILKPEPVKEDKEEEKEEEKEEKVKPLEEKLPEPEFIHAPGAYRMYQAVDLHQHDLSKAKLKNRLQSKTSQMPLPLTGVLGHHQMLPESATVVNAVMEDERRKKEGMKPWLQGRLALSKQTSRFELPMDVRVLESITAMEYLTKYCIISTRRKALFKHIFQKVDKDRDGIISFRELEKGLKEIHVDSIDVKEVRRIVEMVGEDDKTKYNLKQFSAIAAFSERVLFSNFVTEETKGINSTKEIIEEADFCSLKWKLDGFNVNPTVRRILDSL